MTRAWLGLGSNLDEPLRQLQRAVAAIERLPHTHIVARSPVYRNPALQLPEQAPQPDFCNAVVGVDTTLEPHALLAALHDIETTQGRVRGERWGARVIDIDLLLYGDLVITGPQLTVPHPGIRERRFVLQPLIDIAPDLHLPDGTPVTELLAACPQSPLTLIGRLT